MRSHIIIEGPDGAGKTKLARTLCFALGMDYHHEGPPPIGARPGEHYLKVLNNTHKPTVFDRFHLGEIIYGPLLRGAGGLNPGEVRDLNWASAIRGGQVILCLPPWETCLANTRVKEELIKSELMLQAAYDGWVALSRNPVLFTGRVFDYTRV